MKPGLSLAAAGIGLSLSMLAVAAAPPADSQQAFERTRAALPRQSVFFEAGEALVDDEQSAVVIDAVHVAQDFPHDFLRISGHADAGEHDAALAQHRAEAVKRQLMLLGVPAARIEAVAGAAGSPCADEACRTEQRRADIEHAWR